MPASAFYWQLYIATYTALLGLPFLLFPKPVLPLMGFNPAPVDEQMGKYYDLDPAGWY